MFEARHISVAIDARQLLAAVSVAVIPGRVAAVLGPNGAGKSTLLKVMCGGIKPCGGEIIVGGRRLSDWRYHELARIRSVVSQQNDFNFPFTVREVVMLGRNPHVRGRESTKDLKIVAEALAIVEADDLADRLFPTLSGGERQRVHLARALAQVWERPSATAARYLFLDEPTASLDIAHQHLTLQVAKRLARDENVGILVVLHDINLAAQYADELIFLKNGSVVGAGASIDVLNTDVIRDVFGFECSVVVIDGRRMIIPRGSVARQVAVGSNRILN